MEAPAKVDTHWKETWKERLDTLRLKLELGKMDLNEQVGILETDIKAYIAKVKSLLRGYTKKHEKAQNILARFEDIEVQIFLAKADSADALYLEIRKLRDKLHALKWDTLDWLKDVKDDKSEELKEVIEDELEFYTAQLEMINVQLHLGKAEAKEKWEELKSVLTRRLYSLRGRLETEAEGKWEDLKKDMAGRLRKWADRIE